MTEIIKMIRSGDKMGIQIYLKKGGDPNGRNQMCWTLLHLACFEGQAEIAEVLIDGGASVNSCTTDMSTPLHRACAQGNKMVVENLIKKGAYINAQDKNGNTPLHEAAKGFHTSVVKVLIEKKVDKTKENKKKQTFLNLIGQQLMPSVESGDSEILLQWLEWGASPDTKGNLHWSILHHACARGQLNIASLLIERGCDVNIEDSNRTTPLHSSCFHGHSRIATLLIDSKANINAQDQRGNTPLHSAVAGGHPELINLLLERECDTTIPNKEGQYFTHLVNEFLVSAVDASKTAHVVLLIKGRADPNTRDPYGYTVLCQAAFKGDATIVDALLEGGADPNLTDETQGKTPLHYASAWGHLFIVKALLDKGALVNIKDKIGALPLHEAAREGFEDVITVLIGRRCNYNEKDIDGNTPLHIAGKWGQSEAVELMLERGADDTIRNNNHLLYSDLALIRAVRTANKDQVVYGMSWGGDPNSRDQRGWTLLHHAVYKGVEDICELLLESGANINAVDAHGRTPLLLAAYRGNKQIMQHLLDAGADINSQDWMGRTPLHWAAKEGSIDTVQLLLDHKANTSILNKDGHPYSNMLLKHLYFAVRHNDAEKVARLVMAGADQFAEVEGTGLNPREEAKRRGLYDILRQMASLVQKKPRQDDEKALVAVEDVYRLFEDAIITEDGDFTTSGEDQELEEEQDEEDDEDGEEANEETGDDNNDDEDAYWKMSNACEVLTVEQAFGEEDTSWLKEFEEKPKVISAKELLDEEQASFWDSWHEKQKVISAKEFFKEETNWWEKDDKDDNKDDKDNQHPDSSNETSRNDECWWRDARDGLAAKRYIEDEKPWWCKDTKDAEKEKDDEIEEEEDESTDVPWWKSGGQNSEVISAKEFFKDDDKPWWQSDKPVSAKEFFEDEKPWWQEDDSGKILSAKEYLKDEDPWWRSQDEKIIPAKEFFKDDDVPWWYTEEMRPEQPEGLKKSLASVRFYERYLLHKQKCEQMAEASNNEPELSDDEIEESTRTEDYDDATDSLMSDSSTMYSASEGDRSFVSARSTELPWWGENTAHGEGKRNAPKADDFFKEKHWLDDASECSEPTETLDISEISEINTANDLSISESWQHDDDKVSADNVTILDTGDEIDEREELGEEEEEDEEYEDELDEEEEELEEEEEEEMEEEEEEVGEEESNESQDDIEEEEELGDELAEEQCCSDVEDLKSEDEIAEISDEELESVDIKPDKRVRRLMNDSEKADMKILDESKVTDINTIEAQKPTNMPTIILYEIDNESGGNQKDDCDRERNETVTTGDFSSVELMQKVVSKSDDIIMDGNTNIDIGVTNNESQIDFTHHSISVQDIIEGSLQKSDSQTSGFDSSLSLSDYKVRDLSKDSGCEALSVDECVEDTDLSDMTNPVSTETTESLEESISGLPYECDYQKSSLKAAQQRVRELEESEKQMTNQNCESRMTATAEDGTIVDREENNTVVIQMKWDKDEDNNTCVPADIPENSSQIINSENDNSQSQLHGSISDASKVTEGKPCEEDIDAAKFTSEKDKECSISKTDQTTVEGKVETEKAPTDYEAQIGKERINERTEQSDTEEESIRCIESEDCKAANQHEFIEEEREEIVEESKANISMEADDYKAEDDIECIKGKAEQNDKEIESDTEMKSATCNSENTDDSENERTKGTTNEFETKSYAAALKTNLENPSVNKMDDCLARLDASLARVDARLTRTSEENNSNDNLKEKNNDKNDSTYAAVVKRSKKTSLSDNKTSSGDDTCSKIPSEGKAVIKEEKEIIQFMKVHVNVPEMESVTEEEQRGSDTGDLSDRRRFAGGTGYSQPKEMNSNDNDPDFQSERIIIDGILADSERNVKTADNVSDQMNNSNAKANEKTDIENDINGTELLERNDKTNSHGADSTTIDYKENESFEQKTDQAKEPFSDNVNDHQECSDPRYDESECGKTGDAGHESVSESLTDSKGIYDQTDDSSPQPSPRMEINERSLCDKTEKNETKSRELSRESSLERLSSKEGSESPSLHMEKTFWRCSTYDAMSLSDYDNLSFMIHKPSDVPASWGRKKKRKDKADNADLSDKLKDPLTHGSSESSDNDDDQHKPMSATAEQGDEGIPAPPKPMRSQLGGEENQDTGEETTQNTVSGAKGHTSANSSAENHSQKCVPDASSVPLREECKDLGAEACTNRSETSCNQDPPVAPRRSKDSSLQSQKLKYKDADHSADTLQPHALKQPTNTTLYDPDKKETSKVGAAVNVRPDEPRVQQGSSKCSKEGSKKNKEKQKELAVATGKTDPVRKSSSCSVS